MSESRYSSYDSAPDGVVPLKTIWYRGEKFVATLPITLPPDANREALFFYTGPNSFDVDIVFGNPPIAGTIFLTSIVPTIELRYQTHGDLVRGGFTIDSRGSGEVTIIEITR